MPARSAGGLAFWIETASKRILFDAGQTDVLSRNAAALGIDLANVDAIVLSHGHYDHTGGLGNVLDCALAAPVFAHPTALDENTDATRTAPVAASASPPPFGSGWNNHPTLPSPRRQLRWPRDCGSPAPFPASTILRIPAERSSRTRNAGTPTN